MMKRKMICIMVIMLGFSMWMLTGCSQNPEIPVMEDAQIMPVGEGISPVNEFMQAVQTIEAKESASDHAQTVVTVKKDELVFVIGITEDHWYEITCQGKRAFVKEADLKQQTADEALVQEVQEMEAENTMVIEEIERQRAAARQARIWGAVIVLLIAGIFAAGIISNFKNEKKREDETEQEEGEQEAPEQATSGAEINIIDLDLTEKSDSSEVTEESVDR